ncbi:MAG: SPOR domain-containing protein [Enterovibrio sp.]
MKKIISCAILSACFCIYSQQIAAEVQDSEPEIDCPAQTVPIDSQRTWVVTDESCPIGKGIYDQAPSQRDSIFWLQCSYASRMPSKSFADQLEPVVSIDMVVIRKENTGKYRCLIGPFVNYDDVVYLRDELNKSVIKTFIREVPKNGEVKPASLSKTSGLLAQNKIAPVEPAVKANMAKFAKTVEAARAEKSVPAQLVKEAAVKEVDQSKAAAEKVAKAAAKKEDASVAQIISQQQADNVLDQLSKVKGAVPAPTAVKVNPAAVMEKGLAKEKMAPQKPVASEPVKAVPLSDPAPAIAQAKGNESAVPAKNASAAAQPAPAPAAKPFTISASDGDLATIGDRQFYKIGDLYSPVPSEDQQSHFEIDKEWWRASLRQATEICTKNSMQVVTMARLREVANNDIARDKLPKRLPFWVNERKAFDIMMMVPMSLTENSAIYVLCQPLS